MHHHRYLVVVVVVSLYAVLNLYSSEKPLHFGANRFYALRLLLNVQAQYAAGGMKRPF